MKRRHLRLLTSISLQSFDSFLLAITSSILFLGVSLFLSFALQPGRVFLRVLGVSFVPAAFLLEEDILPNPGPDPLHLCAVLYCVVVVCGVCVCVCSWLACTAHAHITHTLYSKALSVSTTYQCETPFE